tara:strand:+ start:3573 stop:3839 length:267 start_codon:yes stop_codon:yes gene_type:complete
MNKITKVNDWVINYRGFYFSVHKSYTFNGSVRSYEYAGLNAGMKRVFWNREDLKKSVDRKIDKAMKLYCEHYGMKTEDSPVLESLLAA